MLADDLERGTLVQVLPDHVGEMTTFSIVYADRELMEPKVRAFIDHVYPKLRVLMNHLAS